VGTLARSDLVLSAERFQNEFQNSSSVRSSSGLGRNEFASYGRMRHPTLSLSSYLIRD
jgi:hypothetical protein